VFIVFLKFSANRAQAGQFMEGHNQWLKHGFDNNWFLVAGSLQAQAGGCVLAHNITHADLEKYVGTDPFVENNVVCSEIFEVSPSKVDERLAFLMG